MPRCEKPPSVIASIITLTSPAWSRCRWLTTIASRVVRSILRCAYCTTAPGPGSRLIRVLPSSMKSPPDAAPCFATMNRAPAVPMKVNFTSPLAGEVGGEAAGWGGSLSRFRHFAKRHLRLLTEVAVIKLGDAAQSVDLVDRLVVANSHDSRKAKRVAACVPARPLD